MVHSLVRVSRCRRSNGSRRRPRRRARRACMRPSRRFPFLRRGRSRRSICCLSFLLSFCYGLLKMATARMTAVCWIVHSFVLLSRCRRSNGSRHRPRRRVRRGCKRPSRRYPFLRRGRSSQCVYNLSLFFTFCYWFLLMAVAGMTAADWIVHSLAHVNRCRRSNGSRHRLRRRARRGCRRPSRRFPFLRRGRSRRCICNLSLFLPFVIASC